VSGQSLADVLGQPRDAERIADGGPFVATTNVADGVVAAVASFTGSPTIVINWLTAADLAAGAGRTTPPR
jgi:hypothetical protein